MAIKYRILKLHPEEHSITVRYYSDDLSERDLRTDPNDPNDPPIQCRTDHFININKVDMNEDDLHDLLCRFAPVGFFEVHSKIKSPDVDTTMARYAHLQDKEKIVEKSAVTPEITPEDIDQLITEINQKNITQAALINEESTKKSKRKKRT